LDFFEFKSWCSGFRAELEVFFPEKVRGGLMPAPVSSKDCSYLLFSATDFSPWLAFGAALYAARNCGTTTA
jgi:hypothetical protein